MKLGSVKTITVIGAYGRWYDELAEAQAHWDQAKDFLILSTEPSISTGSYINKLDQQQYSPQAEVHLLNRKRVFLGKLR